MEKHLAIISGYSLAIGDRIVIPKSIAEIIQHHAIYIGFIDGDHWIIENKDGFGVRVISARDFFKGVEKLTRVEKFQPRVNYLREDLIEFALSLRGKKYDLLKYNCEDFCNQVQHGKIESKQVNFAFGIAAVLLLAMLISSIND